MAIDSRHYYYDPGIIIETRINTLSFSSHPQDIHTGNFIYSEKARSIFLPLPPCIDGLSNTFPKWCIFYSTRARSNFLQITEKCCGGLMKFSGSPHAMRATRRLHISETQRVSMKTSISPHLLDCSFGENLHFLSVKFFYSTHQTLHAPHKLKFTITSIICNLLRVYV